MDRSARLRRIMRKVHGAMTRARAWPEGNRRGYSVALTVPGLGSKLAFEGQSVFDLMVPSINIPEAERMGALLEMVSHLGDPVLAPASRGLIRGRLGRSVLDFALCSKTPEGRLARLLVVFGARTRLEVSPANGTLLVHDASGTYGVQGGKMVGGLFSGVPMALPLGDLFAEEHHIVTRSLAVAQVKQVLTRCVSPETLQLFGLLFVIAEWDKSIPLQSLLLPKPRRVQRDLAALSKTLMEDSDPYRKLYRAMVPYFMTYSDFTAIFGKPDNRGVVSQKARSILINKLYMLPFFE